MRISGRSYQSVLMEEHVKRLPQCVCLVCWLMSRGRVMSLCVRTHSPLGWSSQAVKQGFMSENLNQSSCLLSEEIIRDNEEGKTSCSSVKCMLIGFFLFLRMDKLSQDFYFCVAYVGRSVKFLHHNSVPAYPALCMNFSLKWHDHYPAPSMLPKSSSMCLFLFCWNSSCNWRGGDLMTYNSIWPTGCACWMRNAGLLQMLPTTA